MSLRRITFSILIIRIIFIFWSNSSLYTQPFDVKELENNYFKSSYLLGDKASVTLSDADLYAVEGNLLVNQNKDLEQLTPGHPPLGKYFIGLSQKLFHKPYIFQFISFILILLFFYLLSGSPFLTLVFSFEPLLVLQLKKTLLDIHLLVFHLASIYFFLSFVNQKTNKPLLALVSWFFVGLALATKFFPVSLPLIFSMIFSIILSGNFKKFTQLILTLPVAGLAFLLGHLSYFIHHPSIVSFIKYIRYQINWWAGSPQVTPFSIFKIIFQNRWLTWWGEGTVKVKEWWLGWPIFTFLSMFSYQNKFLLIYLIISLIFLAFQAVFPRHILLILPIIYLLAYGTIKRLWQKIKSA